MFADSIDNVVIMQRGNREQIRANFCWTDKYVIFVDHYQDWQMEDGKLGTVKLTRMEDLDENEREKIKKNLDAEYNVDMEVASFATLDEFLNSSFSSKQLYKILIKNEEDIQTFQQHAANMDHKFSFRISNYIVKVEIADGHIPYEIIEGGLRSTNIRFGATNIEEGLREIENILINILPGANPDMVIVDERISEHEQIKERIVSLNKTFQYYFSARNTIELDTNINLVQAKGVTYYSIGLSDSNCGEENIDSNFVYMGKIPLHKALIDLQNMDITDNKIIAEKSIEDISKTIWDSFDYEICLLSKKIKKDREYIDEFYKLMLEDNIYESVRMNNDGRSMELDKESIRREAQKEYDKNLRYNYYVDLDDSDFVKELAEYHGWCGDETASDFLCERSIVGELA